MHLLLAHPFLAFLVWTLLATGGALLFCKVVAYADAVELPQPEQVGTDTVLIDWNTAPAEWRA